jgi:hypothetical protein
MITPTEALEQAVSTTRMYANAAEAAYYKIFCDEGEDPERCLDRKVAFVAAFMRTAAADFHTWVVHNNAEKAREDRATAALTDG